LFHSEAIEAFHRYRKSIGNPIFVTLNGIIFNQIITGAKVKVNEQKNKTTGRLIS